MINSTSRHGTNISDGPTSRLLVDLSQPVQFTFALCLRTLLDFLLSAQQIMFQLLLKATNPNSTDADNNPPKAAPRRNVLNSDMTSYAQQPQQAYRSSSQTAARPSPETQTLRQTPAFLQKLHEIGHQIEQIADEPEAAGYDQPSEKVSQVLSVNQMTGEDCHPMILSNIHPSEKHSYDKLSLLRIRNQLSELRQVHQDLTEYIEDERRLNYDFQDKISLDIQDFFLELVAKMRQGQGTAEDIKQLKRQNASLLMKLERKDGDYQTIVKELTSLKSQVDFQKITNSVRASQKDRNAACTNCKVLQEQLTSLKEEISRESQEVQRLICENERLQEHIFDIEQKIVGVDLEVEKKLKEKLSMLPEGYHRQSAVSPLTSNAEVTLLKEKIAGLELRCKEYQQKLSVVSDMQSRIAKIKVKEVEIEKREAILEQAQERNQQLKQANYERQHQILEAEENLAAKIADLRQKEAELSSWETELIRKANQTRQPLNLNYPVQEADFKMSFQDELNNSRQISLKSFGRSPQNGHTGNEIQRKLPPRRNYTQEDIETFNPREELYRLSQNRLEIQHAPNSARRGTEARRPTDKVYTSKVVYPTTAARNLKLAKSSYRDSREASPYRNNEHRSRGHYGGAIHGGNQYRDVSKNSRSSAAKSIRGGYGAQVQATRPRAETQQVAGLSSKLERLRQEIKKEIDSIK